MILTLFCSMILEVIVLKSFPQVWWNIVFLLSMVNWEHKITTESESPLSKEFLLTENNVNSVWWGPDWCILYFLE